MNATFAKQIKTAAPVTGHMSCWQRLSCRSGTAEVQS